MMTHLKSFSFLILLLSFSLYSYWYSNKDYVWIVPYMNDRTPAAVKESSLWKDLVEKPMRVFKRDSAAYSIRIRENKTKKLVLTMGQFPVNGSKGINLLCLEYPMIRLKFIADGMSVNGQKPTTTVLSGCRLSSQSSDYISDIPLPFHETDRFPADTRTADYGDDGSQVQLQFENIVGDWPREWVLDSIEFYKDEAPLNESVRITQSEILQKLGSPIVVTAHR